MCGIFFSSNLDLDNNYLLSLQNHRGPDAFNHTILEGKYFIGQNRLSILDLDGGVQPVISADNRYAMSYNGEVYNYIELSREYLNDVNPSGDTAVIIRLFEKYGPDIVKKFIGMFAIILFDRLDNKVYLIRDHFGIKPIYFTQIGCHIAASSEPKVLFKWRKLSGLILEFRDELLSEYFHFRTVTGRNTFVKDVFKVLPSEIVEVKLDSLSGMSFQTFQPEVKDISFTKDFDSIVKMHTRSDVPYGVFLSGGIDSTIVSCSLPKGSVAFTVKSASPELDETRYARTVSDKLSLDLEILDIEGESIRDLIREFAYFNDDPVSDPSAIGLYSICKLVGKKGFKVVLAGEGADELFYGYGAHMRYMLLTRFKKIAPKFVIDLLFRRLRIDRTFEDYADYSKFMGSAHLSSKSDKKSIILSIDKVEDFYKQFLGQRKSVSDELKVDRLNRLAYDILMRSDRASMACGVEIRTPFLTQDVEAFADNLELGKKLSIFKLTGKLFLKDIVAVLFGRKFAFRRKRGFDMDVEQWRKSLSSDTLRFCQLKRIPDLNYDFISTEDFQNNAALFWAWVTLEFWYENHFLKD
jgi:asparagine synthase (glutamine-hydrolysing)